MVNASVSFTHARRCPGWEQRWRQVLQGHRKLSQIYDGTKALGNTDDWEARAIALFVGCHHMGDWFKHDGAVPRTIREEAIPYLHEDPDLRLAAAISNTAKHLERG